MGCVSLKRTFSAHDLSVNAVAISSDGATMLTGADDGFLMVWDVGTGEKIQEISCVFNGPIVSICWIDVGKGDNLAFVFGCADGNLQIYQKCDTDTKFSFASMAVAHNAFVQDITFDRNHGRVASVGGGTAHVWNLKSGPVLESTATDIVSDAGVMVQSVHFCDAGANIVVCLCESHEIVDPWKLNWAKQVPTRIGQSALSSDEQSMFITNLVSGLDQYRFPSMERIRSFSYPIIRNRLMQVDIFGSEVVIGGDDGYARLYDVKSGRLVQMLEHSRDATLVQTVSAYDGERGIIITTSTGDGPSEVKIWTRVVVRSAFAGSSIALATSWIQLTVVALLAATFVSIVTSDAHRDFEAWIKALVRIMFDVDGEGIAM